MRSLLATNKQIHLLAHSLTHRQILSFILVRIPGQQSLISWFYHGKTTSGTCLGFVPLSLEILPDIWFHRNTEISLCVETRKSMTVTNDIKLFTDCSCSSCASTKARGYVFESTQVVRQKCISRCGTYNSCRPHNSWLESWIDQCLNIASHVVDGNVHDAQIPRPVLTFSGRVIWSIIFKSRIFHPRRLACPWKP